MDIYEENAISKLMRARKGNDVKWDIKFKKNTDFQKIQRKEPTAKNAKRSFKINERLSKNKMLTLRPGITPIMMNGEYLKEIGNVENSPRDGKQIHDQG